MDLIVIGALLGLIPGVIARAKGHTFLGYWIFGALLFPIALVVILVRQPNAQTRRQCPHCRTWIDREATACPQCSRDVPAAVAVQAEDRRPWER